MLAEWLRDERVRSFVAHDLAANAAAFLDQLKA